MLTINEIFYSVQGESTYAGGRACSCGSPPATCAARGATRRTRFTRGRKRTLEDVLRRSRALRLPAGRGHGRRAAASGGGLSADGVARRAGEDRPARDRRPSQHRARAAEVVTILDVKCPGSGESERNCWENLARRPATRRGQVRHQGSRRLRIRAGRDRATVAGRARGRDSFLARPWRARPEDAVRVGARRSACRSACSFSCTSTSGAPTPAACTKCEGVRPLHRG